MKANTGLLGVVVGLGICVGIAGRAIALTVPDTGTCNSTGNCLFIQQNGSGRGVVSSAAGSSTAIAGFALSGNGVYGESNNTAVEGFSFGGTGVEGASEGPGNGVYGHTQFGNGVYGTTANGAGVYGVADASLTGAGVIGDVQGSWTAWAGNYNGDVQARGFYSTSDARLKADVSTLPGGMDQLKQLRPVTFKWKRDGAAGSSHNGLIAQEVQQVFPSAVRVDGKSGLLSVSYAELVPVLIKAVQEQQAKIDALELQQRPMASSVLSGRYDRAVLLLAALGIVVSTVRRRVTWRSLAVALRRGKNSE